MTAEKTASNYTADMVEQIEKFAEENGVINNDNVSTLADALGMGVRSVRAKASRMGVYQAKKRESANGGPVETKETIASQIAELIGKSVDGLEAAPKVALQRVRSALQTLSEA